MMDIMWQRACPRCSGNLFIEDIVAEWCVVCLQCGYRKYINREKWHEANSTTSVQPQPKTAEILH